MRFAVAVITKRRPDGLARLFASLDRLVATDGAAPHALSIIVVENDDSRSPMPASRWPCTHVLEPRAGIPFARNCALDEARRLEPHPDWIAFVDDDETVDPSWLSALAHAASRGEADILTGPARPVLPDPVPAWALQTRCYEQPDHPDGTRLQEAYTNNVALRHGVVADPACRFDDRLLKTGGSDTHLFRRLARDGHRIRWCAQAITFEHYPRSRMTRRWALQRAYRVGATNAWIMLDLHAASRLGCIGMALRYLARGVARAVMSTLRGHVAAATMHPALDAAKAVGLVAGALGIDRFEEYATHHGT
jgi:glycosyltransferase involved in cell wall biosynthesis